MTDCATYRAQSGEGGSEGAQIKEAADRRRGKQDATRGWMRARNQSRKLPTTKWRLATRRSGRKGNQPPWLRPIHVCPGIIPDLRRLAALTPLSTLSRWQMGTRTVACRKPDDLASCVVPCRALRWNPPSPVAG